MKLRYLSSALLITLSMSTLTHAQMVGGSSYMKGNYLEVGIDANGAFEGAPWNVSSPPLPGFHYRSGNPFLGFVANPQMDGWTNYDGDFFTPGSPENGWGFTLVDGATTLSQGNNCSYLNQIPCTVLSYSHDPVTGCIETNTSGNYNASGYDLDFQIDYLLKENDLFYTTTVTITNNSGQTIDDFYYYRNVDPDNNEPISFDFVTTNTIVAQPTPTCARAHVSAIQESPWLSYLGFAGVGQNFRVSHGGFSNRNGQDIWNGTLFGSPVTTGDEAISIAYRIQNFTDGQTVQFKFVVILDDAAATAALNNLFYFDYVGSLGGPPPECTIHQDSLISCTGNPVSMSVQGPALSDFAWTWSPAIGLSSSTGTTVTANPPSATTYTVTGTPLTSCYTSNITQTVFVDIMNGPDVSITDPGPQCISFNLNSLSHTDLNSIPTANWGFYTVVPNTLADTVTGIYPGTSITPSDSVNLVYWDPVHGCIDYEPVHIDWGSLGANLSIVNPTCGLSDGEITVNITSTVNSTYTYSLNGGPAVSTNTFTGLPIGSYTIMVSDTLGCTAPLDTVLIYVNAPTITTVTPTLTLCTYTCDGTITINGTGGTTPYRYALNGGAPQNSNVFASLCPGTYTVTLIDSAGCTSDSSSTVGIPPPFTLTPSASDTVCIGESTTISASVSGGAAPFTYVWSNSLPDNSSNVVDPAGTTTYTVHAEDNNGCITTTVNITVVENPPLGVTVTPNQSICPGDTAVITATPSGGNGGPYTFVWTNDQTPAILGGPTHNVHPPATTVYTVSLTDNCGTPAATASTTVTLYPLPAITFTADTISGCDPVTISFANTTGNLSSNTCTWDFSDGGSAVGCNVNHTFSGPGTYDVTLHDITINGCYIDTTIFNMITVYPIPVADFTWAPNSPDIFNPEVFFENLTVGGSTYYWDIAGLSNSTEENPDYTFSADSAGNYNVCLSTVSVNGCVDTVCHNVVVMGQLLVYVPNAFTPDGNGINDIFIPRVMNETTDSYEFYIFNRWGEVVFKTTNKNEGWDGTHNGIKAKEDVYVWKIKVRDLQTAKKYEFNGHVNLLR